ncbi:MAG: HDOD domain-containing protein [Deltaproteobacteria bacterium]|nr:HDOD domain-containing protein [Deltaproteobacteria bacterium]
MIPAFPASIQKVAELLKDEDYAVADVVNVIKHDQAIAANILKISNSAYFGARQKIKTIHDAVVFLGQQQLVRAVQTAGILKIFQKGGKGYASQAKEFWEHAVAVALMSQILCKKIQGREDPVLYTAALLHDVGKVIMGEHVQEYFQKIIGRVQETKCSFLEAEEEFIGINHANLGGRIAEHWNFPSEIRDAIAYHHRPDLLEEEGNCYASLVYLSDQACLMMGLTGGFDALAYTGLENIMRHFDLRMVDLEKSFIELLDALERAKELMYIG